MKQYQELSITIDDDSQSLIEKITQNLSCGWERDKKSEQSLFSTSKIHQFCFKLKSEHKDNCKLWMVERDKKFVVTNIVPIEKQELSITEYNVLINDFVNSCLASSSIKHSLTKDDVALSDISSGINYSLTKDDVALSDILSKDSSQKFYTFSRTANKATGNAHPHDQKKWFDFLYSMVTHKENIGTNEIIYFLCEDGWDKQMAFDLAMGMEHEYSSMEYASKFVQAVKGGGK